MSTKHWKRKFEFKSRKSFREIPSWNQENQELTLNFPKKCLGQKFKSLLSAFWGQFSFTCSTKRSTPKYWKFDRRFNYFQWTTKSSQETGDIANLQQCWFSIYPQSSSLTPVYALKGVMSYIETIFVIPACMGVTLMGSSSMVNLIFETILTYLYTIFQTTQRKLTL